MRLLLLTGVAALACAPGTAASQRYDISCPGGLNVYFRDGYQPVEYAGKEWYSQWMASSPVRPLPSQAWYYAYPDRDIISTDNTTLWTWAEIKVHCWVHRSLYVQVIHYDPVDFGGFVRAIPSDPNGCGEGETVTSASPAAPWVGADLADHSYDPYDPGCTGSGSEGGGGGSSGEGETTTFAETCSALNGTLYYDYFCLEQWNERTGKYETIWCGTAAICET